MKKFALAIVFVVPFISTTPAHAAKLKPAVGKELKTNLLKIRANIERLAAVLHKLLSHKGEATEVTQTELMSLYKQMMLLARKMPTKESIFKGVKNMATHFAAAEKALIDALQANNIVKLVEALETINTTSINALASELHGKHGLFKQFEKYDDTVLAEILDQITDEVDKITQMDMAALGHANELALISFLKSKGFSDQGILSLLGRAMSTPQKLRRNIQKQSFSDKPATPSRFVQLPSGKQLYKGMTPLSQPVMYMSYPAREKPYTFSLDELD